MYDWIILFQTEELFSAVIFITIIFVVLSAGFVIFIIRFKIRQGLHYQEKKHMEEEFERQLMQSRIEVQEDTMRTLGQELHDNICQQISSTRLLAGYAQRRMNEAPAMLGEIEKQLGGAINDIRSLTKSLDREWLEQFNLVENLEAEAGRINAGQSVLLTLQLSPKLPMEADRQLLLFRIIQEALQNALRHSGASEITITVVTAKNDIQATITDNGSGFVPGASTKGLGMRNMNHRARLMSGQIEWASGENGSEVLISIPITRQYHED